MIVLGAFDALVVRAVGKRSIRTIVIANALHATSAGGAYLTAGAIIVAFTVHALILGGTDLASGAIIIIAAFGTKMIVPLDDAILTAGAVAILDTFATDMLVGIAVLAATMVVLKTGHT